MNKALKVALCATIISVGLSVPAYAQNQAATLTSTGTLPIITLGFDDARSTQAEAAAVMTANGIKGTFYLLTGSPWGLDKPRFLTTAQAKTMEAGGQEIGGHTRNHPDLRTLSVADQTTEICGRVTDLINAGFKTPVSFAYPYGYYNSSAESVAQSCGYTNTRSTDGGTDNLPVADPMATHLAGWNNTPGVSLAEMKAWVTTAEQNGTPWTQLLWHDIPSATNPGWGDGFSQDIGQFTQFVVWLKGEANAGRVAVKTAGQVMPALTPGSTVLVNPVRVADSRLGIGIPAIEAGSTNNLQIPGIPSASGVVLNITTTNSAAGGYVALFPAGAQRPGTSTVNLQPGVNVANGASVRVGPNNTISIYSSTKTDVIIDLMGYISN